MLTAGDAATRHEPVPATTTDETADSGANAAVNNSPGLVSGNSVVPPVHNPLNVCGNTVDAPGLLNPTSGISCATD